MLRAENLVKRFEDKTALDGLNTEIRRGCIYGLVGPNGSGKSTLMRLMCGVYRPDASWGDEDIGLAVVGFVKFADEPRRPVKVTLRVVAVKIDVDDLGYLRDRAVGHHAVGLKQDLLR